MTFAEEIEAECENILAAQALSGRGGIYRCTDPIPCEGKAVSWEELRPHLDYEYDRGYGGQDCHDVYIWTEDRVYFVWEYDGATWLQSVPRNFLASG